MKILKYKDFETNQEIIEIVKFVENDIDDKGVLRVESEIDGVPVSAIGTGAAENLQGVDKIILPAGLIKIGNWAFHKCSARTVIIPSSVSRIGALAFSECHSLTNVKVLDYSNRFVHIGNEAFKDCENLKNVDILPKSIPVSCFEGCGKLDYPICKFVVEIGAKAFSRTRMTSLKFKGDSNLKYIGADAFSDCNKLTEVCIPNNVHIGDGAFENCESMTKVSIGEACELGEVVFSNCPKLTTVIWPEDIHTVPYGTFCDCRRLNTVVGSHKITSVKAYAFANTSIDEKSFADLRVSNIGINSFTSSKNSRKSYSTIK